MGNNFDITDLKSQLGSTPTGSSDKPKELDIKFNNKTPADAPIRQANASSDLSGTLGDSGTDEKMSKHDMAKMIASNIGSDYSYNEGFGGDTVQITRIPSHSEPMLEHNENSATRERTMARKPVRPTASAASRRPSQSSGKRTTSSTGKATSGKSTATKHPSSSASGNGSRKRKKKKLGPGVYFGFIGGFLAVILATCYFIGLVSTNGKFLPNTTINDIDVGRMTLAEAKKELSVDFGQTSLIMTRNDGTDITIPLKSFDYECNIDDEIEKLYNDIGRAGWFTSLFSSRNYKIDTDDVTYNESKLIKILDNTKWGDKEPQNARYELGTNGFVIKDAVPGTKLDYTKLKPFLLQKISEGSLRIDLSECDCYYPPEIKKEDLEADLSKVNSLFNLKIEIDFDYAVETLTGADVYRWIKFKDDGTYEVDDDGVRGYVVDLADKYDTYRTKRKFKTTLRGTITIDNGPQGLYGWKLDVNKTTALLVKYIQENKSVTTDPIYATRIAADGVTIEYTHTALESARSAESDIGNTYCEVDITAQRMWYYVDGKVAFETDQIVTGQYNNEKRRTPEGIYVVMWKEKSPYLMRGTGYSTWCTYFSRLSFEGIGFHDLNRYVYGGNVYLNDGSHGCINMKLNEAKWIYQNVPNGTPVVIHY